MEFGVYIRPAQTFSGMLELSQHAEKLGFYGAYINDHVHSMTPDGKAPYIESWTAITGIGVHSKKLKLGHITLFNSLRNPAFLAKSATTLDNMTNGRYDLILGAGWNEPEYIGYDLMGEGKGMPSAGERVTRLKESVQIIRGMLDNTEFSFKGKYWVLDSAINIPSTTQKYMKISVGARKPRMIKITAKYADGINASGDLSNINHILGILKPELEKNGKSIEDFYIHGFAPSTYLLKNSQEYEEVLKRWSNRGTDPKHADEFSWIGTSEVLIEKFRKAQDLGMKMIILLVRPSTNIHEMKEKLDEFHDKVATQI